MRVVTCVLLLSAIVACAGPRPRLQDAAQVASPGTPGDTSAAPPRAAGGSADGRAVVVALPTGRVEQALEQWGESKKRLRFTWGCILLAGLPQGLDGSSPLRTGSYPWGDEEDLDLACIELSQVPERNEVVVTPRTERYAGTQRVVSWLESLGGVVLEPSAGR